MGETNKAIDDLSFVLKTDRNNFMALYNRAMLYFRTGQMRHAVADLNAVLGKYPKFEAGYMARGEAKNVLATPRAVSVTMPLRCRS